MILPCSVWTFKGVIRASRETSDPDVIAAQTSLGTGLMVSLQRGENIIAI